MDIRESIRVLLRRWPIVVFGLVVLIEVMTNLAGAPPQFSAAMTVALTPPTRPGSATITAAAASADPSEHNPYLQEEADLTVISRVTAAAVSDGAWSTILVKHGAKAAYTVAPVTEGPLGGAGHALLITAQDPDADTATRTADGVVQAIENDVATRQFALGVPQDEWIRAQPIGPPVVTRFIKTRVRLVAGAGAGGAAAIIVAAFTLEALSQRRAIARAARQDGLASTWSALRRRCFIAALGLPVVAVAVVAIIKSVPPSYRATTTLVLLPPQLPPKPSFPGAQQGSRNPFLSYDGSLDIMAQVATILVTEPDAAAAVQSTPGVAPNYQVVNWVQGSDPVDTLGDPIPVIVVSATAGSPAMANRTVDAVGRALQVDLANLQHGLGAPVVTQVRSQQVTPPEAYRLHGSKVRALAALGLLGLAALGIAVALVDRAFLWVSGIRDDRLGYEDEPAPATVEMPGTPTTRPPLIPAGSLLSRSVDR
jgi:hypothetical protein